MSALDWIMMLGGAFLSGVGVGAEIVHRARAKQERRKPVSNVGYSLYSGQCYIAANSDYHAARELIASLSTAPPAIRGEQ